MGALSPCLVSEVAESGGCALLKSTVVHTLHNRVPKMNNMQQWLTILNFFLDQRLLHLMFLYEQNGVDMCSFRQVFTFNCFGFMGSFLVNVVLGILQTKHFCILNLL